MKDFLKKMAVVGSVVAAGVAILKKDKVKIEIDKLVKRGKITVGEAKQIITNFANDAKKQQKKLEATFKKQSENIVKKAGVITKKQAVMMEKKIQTLEKKLVAAEKKVKSKIKKIKPKKAVKPVKPKKPVKKKTSKSKR